MIFKQAITLRRMVGVVFFILGFCQVGNTTILKFINFTNLVNQADIIVRARIQNSTSTWEDEQKNLWTYTEIEVRSIYKGDLKEGTLLTVVQRGGVDAGRNIAQQVIGTVTLEQGKLVLLFLQRTKEVAYRPLGLNQGVFFLEEEKGGVWAIRPETAAQLMQTKVQSGIDQKLWEGKIEYAYFIQMIMEEMERSKK